MRRLLSFLRTLSSVFSLRFIYMFIVNNVPIRIKIIPPVMVAIFPINFSILLPSDKPIKVNIEEVIANVMAERVIF